MAGGTLKIPQKNKKSRYILIFSHKLLYWRKGGETMNPKELVKEKMKEKDVSNVAMAEYLKISPAALWDRLNNKKSNNTTITNLHDMLSLLGYKVVVVPKDMKPKDDCYEVE